ncbi:hypothetical protein SAMN05216226_10429 [Halovenus aranensis]|uniref:AMP-binding enzyme n=1 Tax=Halovenus aranensis TaxID=890420 RepID=A0A1G8U3L2_9EURY|nr:hypothetical protein [Halovenus aranensis]SDJ48331.1 hypothetical protein SAMN05216226_10429 [Halovenus aranensis]
MDVSDFETLKDIVAAGRNRESTALDVVRRPAPYSYHKLCTNVWKAGNLLGHYGVHSVGELAVEVGPKRTDDESENADDVGMRGTIDAAEPLLAILGGAIIGGVADMTPAEPVDAPALVAPAHWDIEATAGCTRLAYGGPPSEPSVSHFERLVWSENPIEPPEPVTPTDDAVRFDGDTWTHEELLAVVSNLVDEYGIDEAAHVVLDADVTTPGGFVAGLLTPLAAGTPIVVPEGAPQEWDELSDDDCIVTDDTTAENRLVTQEVTRSMRGTGRA